QETLATCHCDTQGLSPPWSIGRHGARDPWSIDAKAHRPCCCQENLPPGRPAFQAIGVPGNLVIKMPWKPGGVVPRSSLVLGRVVSLAPAEAWSIGSKGPPPT